MQVLVWVSPIIVIGVSILVHELGHFLAAKRVGIDVEKFSFGFGPKLFGIKKGGTEYCISMLFFLGGYVKMAGDELGEEHKSEVTGREFLSKRPGKRNLVVLAGPFMNFLLAIILYTVIFRIGMREPISLNGLPIAEVKQDSPWAHAGLQEGDKITALQGKPVQTWKDFSKIIVLNPNRPLKLELDREGDRITTLVNPQRDEEGFPIIDDIVPSQPALLGQIRSGYPAEAAGLHTGDEILAIDEQRIKGWDDMSKIIHGKPGEEIELFVKRGKEQFKVRVTPVLDQRRGVGVIGVTDFVILRYGLLQSFGKSLMQAKDDIWMLFRVLKLLVLREMSPRHVVAGPIGILQLSGQVARAGFKYLVLFIAAININLSIINLLPIPVLDGGHILLFSIEAIRGRPVSEKKQLVMQKIGLAFVITLLVLLSYNDIARRIGGLLERWSAGAP